MTDPQETIAYDIPQHVTDFTEYFDHTRFRPEHTARGGFADIYSNILGRQKYALKVLRAWGRSGGEMRMRKDFNSELAAWLRIGSHENILKFVGICNTTLLSPDPQPCFLSFWQENGQVNTYLKDTPDADLLGILQGILSGVMHMHGVGVVHGDIRGANILISKSGTPLIADFGLSKLMGRESSTSGGAGTLRWMAPDLFQTELGLPDAQSGTRRTTSSDVWAVGMTVLELLSGRPPYSNFDSDVHVLQVVIRGEKPQFPCALHESWIIYQNVLLELCGRCWALNPSHRPNVQRLYDHIRDLQDFGSTHDSASDDSSLTPRARPQSDDTSLLKSIDSLNLSDPDNPITGSVGPASGIENDGGREPQDASLLGGSESDAISYMTALSNHLTASKRLRKHMVDSRSEGPPHAPRWYTTISIDGSVIGEAFGPSKKLAQEVAAKQAFVAIENEEIGLDVPYLPIFLNRLNVRGSLCRSEFQWNSKRYIRKQDAMWVSTLYWNGTPIGEGKGNSERSAQGEAARVAALDSILII